MQTNMQKKNVGCIYSVYYTQGVLFFTMCPFLTEILKSTVKKAHPMYYIRA